MLKISDSEIFSNAKSSIMPILNESLIIGDFNSIISISNSVVRNAFFKYGRMITLKQNSTMNVINCYFYGMFTYFGSGGSLGGSAIGGRIDSKQTLSIYKTKF